MLSPLFSGRTTATPTDAIGIDAFAVDLIPVGQVPKWIEDRLPGVRRPHLATVHRWIDRGVELFANLVDGSFRRRVVGV